MNPDKPARVGSRLWRIPKHRWLLGIPIGAIFTFIVGVGFTGGFLGGLKYFETETFCTTCHEMQTPLQQLRQSVHGSNAYGIRATCSDCHVPPEFLPGVLRHIEASMEVWGHLIGKIDTPAKFERHKLEMARAVWRELKANDSAECRRCHSYAAMALDKQGPIAAKRHSTDYLAKTGKTCIDCHKGVAHTLPQGM
ncbi:MAG: NapC/NirT family cytochrome c [Gammaproteobacteria bacterium]|nr:NapC/NirT family cytochrome c [Gammaproteobacteria bacterium]